jgi:hypothetical protein
MPPELSVTVKVAVLFPAAVGANTTLTTQEAFWATDRLARQVVVPGLMEKSLAFVPTMLGAVDPRTRLAWPVLVRVIGTELLGWPTFTLGVNVWDSGLNTPSGGLTPNPDNESVCGEA